MRRNGEYDLYCRSFYPNKPNIIAPTPYFNTHPYPRPLIEKRGVSHSSKDKILAQRGKVKNKALVNNKTETIKK